MSREAFERHARGLGYSIDPDTRPGRQGGYWSSHTHLMWETWQAATAAAQAQPAAVQPLREGQVMGEYLDFDRQADKAWTPAEYLVRFGMHISTVTVRAQPVAAVPAATFDLLAHLRRHIEFSLRTFGPGPRAAGVIDHIRKELREIEAAPFAWWAQSVHGRVYADQPGGMGLQWRPLVEPVAAVPAREPLSGAQLALPDVGQLQSFLRASGYLTQRQAWDLAECLLLVLKPAAAGGA